MTEKFSWSLKDKLRSSFLVQYSYWLKRLKFNLLSANFRKWLNTQTIRRQFADELFATICCRIVCNNLLSNCLSVFGHFVRLALKGLTKNEHDNGYFPRLLFFQRSKKSSFPMIHFEELIFQIPLYSCGGSHFKLPNIVKKNLTLNKFYHMETKV